MKCVLVRIWSKCYIEATTKILFKQTNSTAIYLKFLKILGSNKESKLFILILKTILFNLRIFL
jgi:hypothetical protein